MFGTPKSRWRALQTRNPLAASAFVYGVVTTHIFCRPTCPARLARRANIVFYETPNAAATAGFRPCKRCRPEQDGEGEQDAQRRAATQAQGILDRTHGLTTWKEVAKEIGMSPRYLHTAFKSVVGVTPGSYAADLRRQNSNVALPDSSLQLEPGALQGQQDAVLQDLLGNGFDTVSRQGNPAKHLFGSTEIVKNMQNITIGPVADCATEILDSLQRPSSQPDTETEMTSVSIWEDLRFWDITTDPLGLGLGINAQQNTCFLGVDLFPNSV